MRSSNGDGGLLTQFAGVGCGPQCFRAAETFAAMATMPGENGPAAATKTKICGREISFALQCFASRFVAEARSVPLRSGCDYTLNGTFEIPACVKLFGQQNREEFILLHSLLVVSRVSKILRD